MNAIKIWDRRAAGIIEIQLDGSSGKVDGYENGVFYQRNEYIRHFTCAPDGKDGNDFTRVQSP